MTELMQELKELQKKANKYDNLIESNKRIANKISEVSQGLDEIKSLLGLKSIAGNSHASARGTLDEPFRKALQLLKEGELLSPSDLAGIVPAGSSPYALMHRLAKVQGVRKTHERPAKLYYSNAEVKNPQSLREVFRKEKKGDLEVIDESTGKVLK